MKTQIALLSLAGLIFAGCSGSAADPKTVGRSDLNPPGTVVTVTKDGAIELRWTAGNPESDFVGYHVFGVKTASVVTPTAGSWYPTSASTSTITTAGIPRCKDNTKFFESFGLNASTADCAGAATSAETQDSSTSSFATQNFLDDTSTSAGSTSSSSTTAASTEVMKNFIPCYDTDGTTAKGNSNISYAATAPASGTIRCIVKQVYDGSSGLTSIANGTSYSFIVMAVMSDKYNKLSWSSNEVSDTPSATAYSASFTLSASKYMYFTIDTTKSTATISTSQVTCTSSGGECSLRGTNSKTTDGIYIGRDTGSNKQRMFISTPSTAAGGTIRLLARGPQTYDPQESTTQARIPGDKAVTYDPSATTQIYNSPGTVMTVYDDKVFDFVVTSGTSYYYGKIVITSSSLAIATDNTSDATVNATIVMQPTAGTTDYWK